VDIVSAGAAPCGLASTLLNPTRFLAAEHYGGCMVGLFDIYKGMRVLRDASLDLMDAMLDGDFIERIRVSALQVNGVKGVK
jgi:divalent metal cation (Fe/Co/Zn/Cd) transporter